MLFHQTGHVENVVADIDIGFTVGAEQLELCQVDVGYQKVQINGQPVSELVQVDANQHPEYPVEQACLLRSLGLDEVERYQAAAILFIKA